MTTSDRRREIINIISYERHTTISKLMDRFKVSRSTIKRDLIAIEASGDISFYTEDGPYGGIFANEGWTSHHNYLKPEQEAFLRKLYDGLQTEDDKAQMESIFADFALPKKLA